jgi:outer membrane protein TolC
MKTIRSSFYAMLAMLMMLTACAQVGLSPAETFDQKLAYGYSTVTAVRTSAAQALNAGTIDITEAKQALSVTDSARSALDAAGASFSAGDTTTAMGKLEAATTLLTQLQAYLNLRGKK